MEHLAWLAQATGRTVVVSAIGVLVGMVLGIWYVRRDRRRGGGGGTR